VQNMQKANRICPARYGNGNARSGREHPITSDCLEHLIEHNSAFIVNPALGALDF
jgi:hypothetical protein